MNILKFSVLFLIAFLFSIAGAYGIVTTYYQSFISEYGYIFGLGTSYLLMSVFSLFGLLIFIYACTFFEKPKKAILWLIGFVMIVAPVVCFMISSLSKEDRVYQQALNSYGTNFNYVSADYQNKMKQHPDYIAYKYQIYNFEKDKESRSAYVALLNSQFEKYKKYRDSASSQKSLSSIRYYVSGSDFNVFLLRYKGFEDQNVQKELHEITKSGIVSYNDMMDFQVKFVDNYKRTSNKDNNVIETQIIDQPTGIDLITPTIPEYNQAINDGVEIMENVEADVLTKDK